MNMFVEVVPSFIQHVDEPKNVNAESGVYVEFYRRRIGGGWVLNGTIEDVDDSEYCDLLSARFGKADQD